MRTSYRHRTVVVCEKCLSTKGSKTQTACFSSPSCVILYPLRNTLFPDHICFQCLQWILIEKLVAEQFRFSESWHEWRRLSSKQKWHFELSILFHLSDFFTGSSRELTSFPLYRSACSINQWDVGVDKITWIRKRLFPRLTEWGFGSHSLPSNSDREGEEVDYVPANKDIDQSNESLSNPHLLSNEKSAASLLLVDQLQAVPVCSPALISSSSGKRGLKCISDEALTFNKSSGRKRIQG